MQKSGRKCNRLVCVTYKFVTKAHAKQIVAHQPAIDNMQVGFGLCLQFFWQCSSYTTPTIYGTLGSHGSSVQLHSRDSL